ncbi:Cyclin-dependent kinase 6 [Vanrija albida]|uniref:Cyclin-dependent kinase 6 n=1 Tax=Vanrija albida TaxID=181172 RepID=A0ABR3PU59_9TREE
MIGMAAALAVEEWGRSVVARVPDLFISAEEKRQAWRAAGLSVPAGTVECWLRIMGPLGQGAFGSVFRLSGIYRGRQLDVALKVIVVRSRERWELAKREVVAMRFFSRGRRNPHMIHSLFHSIDKERAIIKIGMPMAIKSLSALIDDGEWLGSVVEKLDIAGQVVKAVAFMADGDQELVGTD